MAKQYLLLALILFLLIGCDRAGKSLPPDSSETVPEPSEPPAVSASSEPVSSPGESEPLPSSSSSAESLPEPSLRPCPEDEPDIEDNLPELEEGLFMYEETVFRLPVADSAGARHTALYQNYSAMTLAIPTDNEQIPAYDKLEALITAHSGVILSPEDPPDTLIALLPLEGYNRMLSAIIGRISGEFATRFERLSSQDLITHFERFEVLSETYDAVLIYMVGNQVPFLTEIETKFIDELTEVCNLYHELSGQGGSVSTPVYFIDDETGVEYSHLW